MQKYVVFENVVSRKWGIFFVLKKKSSKDKSSCICCLTRSFCKHRSVKGEAKSQIKCRCLIPGLYINKFKKYWLIFSLPDSSVKNLKKFRSEERSLHLD